MPYKRGKKWIAQVTQNGKKTAKRFLTKNEALEWEAQIRKEMESEIAPYPDENRSIRIQEERKTTSNQTIHTTCLGEWTNNYLDYAKSIFSEKTYKEKCAAFRSFFKSVDPLLPVEELDSDVILKYLLIQKDNRSGNAANKDKKNLKAGWNWGMRYMKPKLPGPNPFIVESMPEKRHPRYIPPEEDFWKVYEVAKGQEKIMLLTFLYLAARRGEVFKLMWSDVDLKNSRIRIWTKKRKDGSLEYDLLPVPDELHKALSWWHENRPIKDTEYVFVCLSQTAVNEDSYGKPFVSNQQLMHRLCKRAGVKYFGLHAIRHLTATTLYKMGYRVRDIQPILRHKSPKTTEIYLGKLGLDELENVLSDLNFRFKRGSDSEGPEKNGRSKTVKKPSIEPSTEILKVHGL